jgi:hypothetical protein
VGRPRSQIGTPSRTLCCARCRGWPAV